MFYRKVSLKSLLTALAIITCTLGGTYNAAVAQGGSGLVLFGKKDVDILDYHLDFGGQRNARDRYRLRIPGKKLENGAMKFVISYPDYFDGKFDTDKIEVRLKGDKKKSLPLKEVIWDKENYLIQIELEEPLEKKQKVELVFSNVKNPDVGTYYFFAQVVPVTDIPMPQQVGAWVVSINP